MKNFKGKAIYNPSGKAGEYSYWACNFYVGCSNGCEYCYCKKGILKEVMGMDKPQLKKCFKDEKHALEVFEKELLANLDELRKHSLFFSFTTDPMLPETFDLTYKAMGLCAIALVPIKLLTKTTWWVDGVLNTVHEANFPVNKLLAFGFTLTGHDELEPNASTNAERIKSMRFLYEKGFKTFASIEPIIHLSSSAKMIRQTERFCDLYKIGLLSGKKFDKIELNDFVWNTVEYLHGYKVYFKDSLLKSAGVERTELPSNCVNKDYNIFTS